MNSSTAFGGNLESRLIRPARPHKARSIRIPGIGRVILTSDPGESNLLATDTMQSSLGAVHRDGDGKVVGEYDFGSGNVQNNLVMALMQDTIYANGGASGPNYGAPVLNKLKYMYSGQGATVTTYDVQLQTTAGPASGSITPTLGYVAAGSSNGTNAVIQWVGTIAYTTTLSITEWGLFNAAVQGAQVTSTTNTWNAQGQATATWGATLGASANAFAGYVAYQSGTTTGMYIISNTTGTSGVIVGATSPTNAFYLLTSGGGAGSTPSSNTSTAIYPLMADHKSFTQINVVNGDSIQFTYSLTLASGG